MPFGEALLSWYVTTKYQSLERRTICPRCGENGSAFKDLPEKGLHCSFCGWDEGVIPLMFTPRLPEGNNQ